jgi:hypothetical protein
VGRHTKTVTVTAPGRDKGKQFLITEMDADKGERFAARALLALSRGGIDLPEGIFATGFAGLANIMPYLLVVGLRSLHGAQWAEVEPLLDEMMACVQFVPPGTNADPQLLQPLFQGENAQTEEVTTRFMLRKEVVQLHVGFSLADAASTSGQPPQDQSPSA